LPFHCTSAAQYERLIGIYRLMNPLAKIIASLASVACWACFCLLATAAGAADRGLVDSLSMFSSFANGDPKRLKVLNKILDRVPPDVRRKVKSSDWIGRNGIKDAKQLDADAFKPDLVVMTAPGGLASYPRGKIKSALRGLVELAIEQPETIDLLRAARKNAKPLDRKIIDQVLPELEQIAKDRKAGTNYLTRTGKEAVIQGLAGLAADRKIQEFTNTIRDEINQSGAQAVFDKYRRQADAAFGPLTKPGSKPPGSQPPKGTAGGPSAGLGAKIDADLARLDKQVGQLAAQVADCKSQTAAVPANLGPPLDLDGHLLRQSLKDTSMESTVDEAGKIGGAIAAFRRLINKAGQTAAAVCNDPAKADRTKLDRDRLVARGTFEAARAELNGLISKLSVPLDAGRLQRMRQGLNPGLSFCQSSAGGLRSTGNALSAANSAQLFTGLIGQIESAIAQAVSKNPGFDATARRARLAGLKQRSRTLGQDGQSCRDKANDAARACESIVGDDAAGRLDRMIARTQADEKARVAALSRMQDLLRDLETDYRNTKQAAAQAQGCLDRKDERQSACDQDAIKQAYREANGLYGRQNFAGARSKVQEILSKFGGCPGIDDKVNRDENLIDQMVGGVTGVRSAIGNCDIPRMQRQILKLEAAVSKITKRTVRTLPATRRIMLAWVVRIRSAIEQCERKTAGAGAGGGGTGSATAGPGAGSSGSGTAGSGAGGAGSAAPGTASAGGAGAGTGGAGTEGCVVKRYYLSKGPIIPSPPVANCEGPCPASPGWIIPLEARCRAPGQTGSGPAPTAQSSSPAGAPVQSAISPPASAPAKPQTGRTSGCGAKPTCRKGCRPTAWQCLNNSWVGGHCECKKGTF
jgi:hypothetical protein